MVSKLLSIIFLLIILTGCGQAYKKLHRDAVVVDTHNDVMISILEGHNIEHNLSAKTHSDIHRFKKGGVDVQIFSIWSDERYGKGAGFNYANRQIDSLYAIADRNPGKLMIVKTPQELAQAVAQKKLGVMMGMEGGHMIEDRLNYLDSLYKRGVRYMTLTWNNSTSWATSAADETSSHTSTQKKGLNEFGEEVVRRMNELGMLVDLSHAGEQTFYDALRITSKPVIVSHSCVYSLCPHRRNLKDDQIKAIAKNGGVIHLNFYSGFLDSSYEKRKDQFILLHKSELDSLQKLKWQGFEIDMWASKKYPAEVQHLRPPFSVIIDHLDYLVKMAGIDHVGLGSDFDGIESTPLGMNDVADMPAITKALLAKGYSKKDIKKILGENFIRIFEAAQNTTNNK